MNNIKQLCIFSIVLSIFLLNTNNNIAFGNLPNTDSVFQLSTIDSIMLQTKAQQENSLLAYKKELKSAKLKKDTAQIIRKLTQIVDVERFRGNHEEAFEKLWEALLLSEATNNIWETIQIHRNLGILYDIYNKDSLALQHLNKALNLSKKYKGKPDVNEGSTISCYFSIATHYRNKQDYQLSLAYLDSCSLLNIKSNPQPYVMADRGVIYLKLKQLDLAESQLFKALQLFRKNNKRYEIAVLSFVGDLKLAQNQTDSALIYYKKSLDLIKTKNSHLEFRPDILDKISTIYARGNKFEEAYKYLHQARANADSLFSVTRQSNNRLFEIKNDYKKILTTREQQIRKQELIISKKNKAQLWLLILIIVIVLLSIGFYVFNVQKNKIKKLALQQALEREKKDMVLGVKSKELTTYALQLIEKEQAVNELLETIKTEAPSRYNALNNKHAKANKSLWNEFNLRFIEVNANFYENLRIKHPELTSTEQKHCALIKLNFDSSEMARILNISLQSVHTSRYRIRKKMGLDHGNSLSHYIGSL